MPAPEAIRYSAGCEAESIVAGRRGRAVGVAHVDQHRDIVGAPPAPVAQLDGGRGGAVGAADDAPRRAHAQSRVEVIRSIALARVRASRPRGRAARSSAGVVSHPQAERASTHERSAATHPNAPAT